MFWSARSKNLVQKGITIGIAALAAACALRMGPSPLAPELPSVPCGEALQVAIDTTLQETQGPYELGVSAAVIIPGYAPWAGVSGVSRPGEPMSPEMVFQMGSIAKTFEAALALQLAEEGVLNLDEPIATWLPPLDHVDRAITVRQLLNHTSGVFNVFEHPDFPWIGPGVDYTRQWKLAEVFGRFVGEPYGLPGYAQHYSSTNYLLLTAILEQVLNAPIPPEVARRFFDPLDLDRSFMSMGALPPEPFAVAHPWVDVDLDGELEDLSGVPQTWIASLTHPVLYARPLEIARWMDALLQEGVVLSERSLGEMLSFPDTALPDPEGGRYGLGIVDFSDVLGENVIGHGGSALGYSAAALYLPDEGISLAWAINTGESPRELADSLMMNTWEALSGVIISHCFP